MKKKILFLVVLLAISVAIATYQYLDKKPASQFSLPPTFVKVEKVTTQDLELNIHSFARVAAGYFTKYAAETSGIITKVAFTAGEKVEKGQVLFQLDDQAQRSRVVQAATEEKLSKLEKERIDKLAPKGVVSQQEKDKVSAAFEKNQANLALEEYSLSKATVRAPFAGIVGASNVGLGDYVAVGTYLVSIVNQDKIDLIYKVPSKFLSQLNQGQVVVFNTDVYPKQSFYATVYYIAPYVDLSTNSIEVRAKMPNEDHKLTQGMTGFITQHIGVKENALIIQDTAVIAELDGFFVYTVVDNKAHKVKVTIGQRQNKTVEIISGLQAGDLVVIEGASLVKNGYPVKIAE